MGDTGKKQGFTVEMASIEGGERPVNGLDLQDAVNARYWNNSAFRAKLSATKKLSSLDPKGFSAVFFAGGHGVMWNFPDDKAVQKTIREIYQGGSPVGAVCHGPTAFTNAEEEAADLTKVVPFLLVSKL